MKFSLKVLVLVIACSGSGLIFAPFPPDENPGPKPTVLEWTPPEDSDDDENPSIPPAQPVVTHSPAQPWTAVTRSSV